MQLLVEPQDAVEIIGPGRAEVSHGPRPPGSRRWRRRNPGPSWSGPRWVREGPAEVGEPVLDLPGRFGVAFDQAVLLEPVQGLGEDLARDAADEIGELAVPARLLAEPEQDEHRPFTGDDLDRQAGGAVSEDG